MSTEHAQAILRRLDQVLARLEEVRPVHVPRLLTIQEAADSLGVSRDTIRRMCDRRELRYIQDGPGASKRIAAQDLQAWADQRAVAPVRR